MSTEALAQQYKLLRPLLDRAQEIQAVDPLTAYYTRMCAVQEGIKIPQRHPDISALISKVMKEMEAAKPKLALGGPENDRFHVEAFALKIFAGADKQDRAGKRDEAVMKRYFAAAQFFRVLEQFGPLDEQMEGMRKYAGYRAVVIHKALKSGEECPPPPDTADIGSEQLAVERALDAATLNAPPGAPPPPPMQPPQPPPPPASSYPAGSHDTAPAYPVPTPPAPAAQASAPFLPQAEMPAIFQQGGKVLFRAHGSAPVEQGTIIQVHRDAASIALPDRLEKAAAAHQLAPLLEPGWSVLYQSPDGRVQEATVAGVHSEVWPPSYTVQLADGGERNTDHTRFLGACARVEAPPGIAPVASLETLSPGPRALSTVASAASSTFTNAQDFPYPAGNSASTLTVNDQPSSPFSEARQLPLYPPAGPPAHFQPSLPPLAPSGSSYRHPAPPPPPAPDYHPAHAMASAAPGFEPSAAAVALASKKARECISSLNFQDIDSAVKCLHIALEALTRPQ